MLCVSSWAVRAASETDSLLNVYISEIGRSDSYISIRQARIDSMRSALHDKTGIELEQATLNIAHEYQHFQFDSALCWYSHLRFAGDSIRNPAYVELLQLCNAAGYYPYAITLLEKPGMPSIRSVEGYTSAWFVYKGAADEAFMFTFEDDLEQKARCYYDSLTVYLRTHPSPENDLRLSLYEACDRQQWAPALQIQEQLFEFPSGTSHPYAILAYERAMLYEKAGDAKKRNEWLLRSAITDVRCGITDNGASWLVAKECFENNDLQHAYIICDYTLTNASFFNAPKRYVQTYQLGHVISSEYEKQQHRLNLWLIFVLMGVAGTIFCIAIISIIALRQNKRLSVLNRQLSSTNAQLKNANRAKEQYICRYLEVYSAYIRRLTSMARRAGEKDPASFMNREMENFYHSFDDTFLSLYGTFAEDFNALLKPEAQITPKPGERMTVEMRIFALILLGIDSSSKIAELLCYSPNTISNYRVKIKNNALGNRDEFEQQVKAIASKTNG